MPTLLEWPLRRVLIRTLIAASILIAAASLGYFLSSRIGQEVIRTDVERRLAELFRGPVAIDRMRIRLGLGLQIEGMDVRVYPEPAGPALSAARVLAEVDALALLSGDFHLRQLEIEDLHYRMVRWPDGRWSPYPMDALDRQARETPPDRYPGHERRLALLRAFEGVTRYLLEETRVATRVELRGGRVELFDHVPRGTDGPPSVLRLESIYGSWDHRWWSDMPEVSLRAVLVDERKQRTRIEADGRRLDEGELRLSVGFTELPLDPARVYLRAVDPGIDLDGRVSGLLSFSTAKPAHGVVVADWVFEDLELEVPRKGDRANVADDRIAFNARLDVRPDSLRLADARMKGDQVEFEISGLLERPLRDDSRARLATTLRGADLPAVHEFTDGLPPADREALIGFLGRARSGDIPRIGLRGTSRFALWRQLLRGELTSLPRGVVLSADLSEVTMTAQEENDVEKLSGTIEWTGDRIDIRGATALFRGEPLPTLDLTVDGVSNLLAGTEADRRLRAEAGSLRGVAPLTEIVRELSAGSDDAETADVPDIHVAITELHHEAVGFPLEHAALTFRSRPDGLEVAIERGQWAGAPIQGEGIYLRPPVDRISVSLRAEPSAAVAIGYRELEDSHVHDTPPGGYANWAWGRIDVEALREPALAFEHLEGDFRIEGSRIHVTDVDAALIPSGRLEGHLSVDLDRPKSVPIDASFQLNDGDLARLGGLFGLPRDLATGSLRIVGTLDGKLRPDQRALRELKGVVSFAAREGTLRRKVPLVLAVAQATEGFNPFATRESVHFESIDTVFRLDEGRVHADEFELEGPMRVFASGRIDMREEPSTIDAVVGVFLFRQADRTLGRVPLVRNLVSDKGMMGAYFEVRGPLDDPEVETLGVKTLTEQVPDILKAPFRALRFLIRGRDERREGNGSRHKDVGPRRR